MGQPALACLTLRRASVSALSMSPLASSWEAALPWASRSSSSCSKSQDKEQCDAAALCCSPRMVGHLQQGPCISRHMLGVNVQPWPPVSGTLSSRNYRACAPGAAGPGPRLRPSWPSLAGPRDLAKDAQCFLLFTFYFLVFVLLFVPHSSRWQPHMCASRQLPSCMHLVSRDKLAWLQLQRM